MSRLLIGFALLRGIWWGLTRKPQRVKLVGLEEILELQREINLLRAQRHDAVTRHRYSIGQNLTG